MPAVKGLRTLHIQTKRVLIPMDSPEEHFQIMALNTAYQKSSFNTSVGLLVQPYLDLCLTLEVSKDNINGLHHGLLNGRHLESVCVELSQQIHK